MENEPNILDLVVRYYYILMRRKWIIIGITALSTAAAVAFAIISIRLPPEESPLPNVYTAEAVLFILQTDQTSISDTILSSLGVEAGGRTQSGFNNGDLVLEILHSRTILDRLIEEFNLIERYRLGEGARTKAREILQYQFNFIYTRPTGSLRITFVNTDPVFARDVVNRTVELLNEWFIMNRGLAKQKLKQNLEEKLEEVTADINTLQNRLKSLQRRYGVLNAQELGVSQATSLANLRSQLIMKEIEIKNYSIYSKINDPRLEQLNEELRNLRELINQNQTTIPDISQENGAQRNLADVAQEFSQLTTELDIQQRIYNTLSPQYEAAKLTPESEPIFQVFELAEIPDVKTGPQRSRLVAMAGAGGLAGSIALVIFLHLLGEWRKEFIARASKFKAAT